MTQILYSRDLASNVKSMLPIGYEHSRRQAGGIRSGSLISRAITRKVTSQKIPDWSG